MAVAITTSEIVMRRSRRLTLQLEAEHAYEVVSRSLPAGLALGAMSLNELGYVLLDLPIDRRLVLGNETGAVPPNADLAAEGTDEKGRIERRKRL